MAFQSFSVVTILVVLIILGAIAFAIIFIFVSIIKYFLRKEHEKELTRIIERIDSQKELFLKDDEYLQSILKPKGMKLVNENNEIIIYYKKWKYNTNSGRYY
ncbi:MAG: hypothetical protein FWD24_00545 [Treponema sp.]|nr:hypothetical protein [Treponema sp.]